MGPANFKIFHIFTKNTPKCLELRGKISKIFKARIFKFFQLQNSFHVKTTCLGPFPAKFKIFHFFTKKTPKCLGLRGENYRKFLKLDFSSFFNFRTRFMSKQHVWDHFQQNLKFFIFSPKKRLSAWGLGGKIFENFQNSIFQLFSTSELVSC